MSDLTVSSVSIEQLINMLRRREWLVPQFQREFVWTVANVIDLARSILHTRPIGMATIWEQADDGQLELAPIKLADRKGSQDIAIYFSNVDKNPSKVYAILDGRQRCTAIAMAFAGFHSQYGSYKFSGRYYLDVATENPLEQIVFIKEAEVLKRGLDKDAACMSQGLFPLSSNQYEEQVLPQWMRYLQMIRDPQIYSDGKLPATAEINRRDAILKSAFDGLIKTKLAVYAVPESYNLSDICEIFETLNTTGTKVSTVDLIHSWLYADTSKDAQGPILLRDWIDDLGQKDGAMGWASSQERPELIAQLATACYVALEDKVPTRPFGRGSTSTISSIKAGDLLATPTQHWKNIIKDDTLIAEYLGEFQKVVAGGYFPWINCPYPVSATIYVALRYHSHADEAKKHRWTRDDLNSLYKAFFWRNALSGRYDQGFLTQLGTDIRSMKDWLNERNKYKLGRQWAEKIAELLNTEIKYTPKKEELVYYLTDGRPGGALQKALFLPMLTMTTQDLIDKDIAFNYPYGDEVAQIHHIYPINWCKTNQVGSLEQILDKNKAGRDWANSVANLMPLSRQSNNLWKSKLPGQVFLEKKMEYDEHATTLNAIYIDKTCFEYIKAGDKYILEFWKRRAGLIADDMLSRMTINY